MVELSGTSGGSIVASLYASGMSLDVLRELCMSLDWSPMMSFSPWALVASQSLCSGNTLLQYLQKLTDGKKFSDLSIELKVIASDLLTEKEFVFSRAATPDAELATAARASASIPLVFAPVAFANSLLVDGGCCNNMPASVLTIDDVPRLGIYLESDDAPLKPGNYGLRTLAPRIIDLLLASNESSHVALDTKNGATIVHVLTGFASSFDRNMSAATRQKLYAVGYTTTATALAALPTVASA
ncbi:patatin-like phospholipase family protein [Paraburkholderia acidisoli]|uniref:patatin-like phospholipase family protein n=1 Tax=Paraburkholderia acidisoli TaxID=2571748 RepID=UPI001E3C9BEE|nr:patatin-like phospholipase family protein [Paraburkholderia acidisoli]